MSRGSLEIFLTRPATLILLALALASIAYPLVSEALQARRRARIET
jgi:TctA family transporter